MVRTEKYASKPHPPLGTPGNCQSETSRRIKQYGGMRPKLIAKRRLMVGCVANIFFASVQLLNVSNFISD